MAKSATEVRKKFAEENMYCEIHEHENGCISIEIEWGDWKHDHAYSDHLMREMGYDCTDEQVTEENGSDCYSSVHFYEKMEG